MGIERVVLDDFTGGYIPRLAATDFSQRQWSKLHGFVLEDVTRIRSQWELQRIGTVPTTAGSPGTEFDMLSNIGGTLIARKPDGTFWYRTYVLSTETWSTTRALTWTQLAIPADTELRPICAVPLDGVSTSSFKKGLLINGRDRTGSAWAVYHDDAGVPQLKEWTAKWPAAGGTDNVMPPANDGVMWGDFLVLGDIRWYHDPNTALSDTNNKPFGHGLWFSQGGNIDHFDPLDVEFATFSGGGGSIAGFGELDAGLAVFCGGVYLLRGQPSSHSPENLRHGLHPAGRGVRYWPYTGTYSWIDAGGQVWHTDGERVVRLDSANFDLGRTTGDYDIAHGWGEFLLVERNGQLFCLRAFDDEGAWTELIAPADGSGNRHMIDPVTFGDQLNFLGADGNCWRFNRRYETIDDATSMRGKIDGTDTTLTLATRTLDTRGGHERTFWHRVGIRAKGPGTIGTVTVRPGPARDTAQPSMAVVLNDALDVRHDQVVEAHGPSPEMSAEVTFTGDVQVEQLEVWHHRGRGER